MNPMVLLTANNLYCSYGTKSVLHDISFSISSGTITGLIHAKKQTVSSLSKGMRNRVNFCRALLKDIQILYLDEPTSGLDPATTEKIHELILEERKKGTAVFLTTHNMYEAQKLCDNILLLNSGTIVEQGKPEEICLKYNQKNVMTLTLKDGKKLVFPNSPAYASHVARLIQ